tara:strand:+ start:685 stop:990 length:306 start_codon:yes stop_codon:yes gene_type:complete
MEKLDGEKEIYNKIENGKKIGLYEDGLHCPNGEIIPKGKSSHVKEYPHTEEEKELKKQWLPQLIANHPDACPVMLEWLVDEAVTKEGLEKINKYVENKNKS